MQETRDKGQESFISRVSTIIKETGTLFPEGMAEDGNVCMSGAWVEDEVEEAEGIEDSEKN